MTKEHFSSDFGLHSRRCVEWRGLPPSYVDENNIAVGSYITVESPDYSGDWMVTGIERVREAGNPDETITLTLQYPS